MRAAPYTPALGGRRLVFELARRGVTAVRADEHSVHVRIDGRLVRTLPSNLSTQDLHELRLRGAVPAGPPPADHATRNRSLPAGAVVEVDRTVNADGVIGLGGHDLLQHVPRTICPASRETAHDNGTNIALLDRCRGAEPGQQNRDGSGGAVPEVPIPFLHTGLVNEFRETGHKSVAVSAALLLRR